MPATHASTFTRRETNRMVSGVAGGVADSLGVTDAYVRAAFLTMATVWGLGVVVYVALWALAYERVGDREPRSVETGQRLGLVVMFVGGMALLGFLELWPDAVPVITMATLSFGLAFLTDHTSQRPLAALLDPNVKRPGGIRLLLGLALLVAGLVVFSTAIGRTFEVGAVLVAIMLTAFGVLVAFGPMVRRLFADLAGERNERIRQEERAEMAAHLHDSVLQTLALIQRSDDPARMTMLARHQETELRDWLYGAIPLDGIDLMSTALRQTALKVEADHGVPVDVVCVGDHPVEDSTRPLVAAATEAMVNAARHSGAPRVSVYFEADSEQLTVYVTDQGKGFDPANIGSDRKGISESIYGRMERAGGSAEIVSEEGEGTELVISLPLVST